MGEVKEIMVSIVCESFNHERFLRQCLDGFVMQKTNFAFEILIHDDASTDKSQDIIREYMAKYPELDWKPILQTENQFSKGVGIWRDIQFPRAKGKYIAICEGDDYWTDPLKLQKQVDILEADDTLMGCVTNCSVVDKKGAVLEEKRIQPVVRDNKPGRYSLRDFFDQGHQYPTLSAVYRNTHRKEVSEKCQTMRNPYMGDWTLWIALLCFGDFYYLDEPTCAYRINPTSLTHDQSKLNARRLGQAKEQFRLLPRIASILPEDYKDIKDDLCDTRWNFIQVAHAYSMMGKYGIAMWWTMKSLVKHPQYTVFYFRRIIWNSLSR